MISSWPEPLLWRHYVTAQAAHASVGLISDEVLALAVEIGADTVVFHAVVTQGSDKVLGDLDDLCFEMDALLAMPRVAIEFRHTVGYKEAWPPEGTVPLYRAQVDDTPDA
jgi:hypothetical protein